MLGPVALAVQNGDVLILDEIDRAQPEYLTALQAILEDTSAPLVLNDDGGWEITPHPDFRIVATSNTLGQPEDLSSGYAAGAAPMNQSMLDRFAILRVTFPENEADIINDIIRHKTLSNKMVKLATLCRQAVSNGEMSCWDFSTRRLIAWTKTFTAHILFTPKKYTDGLSCFPRHLRNLINLLEDIRIERLYARQYSGVREDLSRLNRTRTESSTFI